MAEKEAETLAQKLVEVQSGLHAPKGQFNKFGGYSYRSCEDILEAVKPLLAARGLVLTLTDSIQQVGERTYVKTTATVTDGTESVSTDAWAQEPAQRKGMDVAQVTGSSSSYARKYALNGLFCIDDNRDPDTADNRQQQGGKPKAQARPKAKGADLGRVRGQFKAYMEARGLASAKAATQELCELAGVKSMGQLDQVQADRLAETMARTVQEWRDAQDAAQAGPELYDEEQDF